MKLFSLDWVNIIIAISVVAADVIGRSMSLDQRRYDPPDLASVDPAIHVDA